MPQRLRVAARHLGTSKVVLNGETVNFVRNKTDWVSDPVSDEIVESVENHPHYHVFDTNEEFENTPVDPKTVDYSNASDVERWLRELPAEDLSEALAAIPCLPGFILDRLPVDTLRQLVRDNVPDDEIIDAFEDPIQLAASFITSNADTLTDLREASDSDFDNGKEITRLESQLESSPNKGKPGPKPKVKPETETVKCETAKPVDSSTPGSVLALVHGEPFTSAGGDKFPELPALQGNEQFETGESGSKADIGHEDDPLTAAIKAGQSQNASAQNKGKPGPKPKVKPETEDF